MFPGYNQVNVSLVGVTASGPCVGLHAFCVHAFCVHAF